MSTPVFTFEWDLSSGWLSPIVRHVGILVFGTFYEFNKKGIVITKIEPGCLPPTPVGGTPLKEFGVELGRTTKTQQEFDNWISKRSSDEFKTGCYNVVLWNCIIFGNWVCKFLGVDTPVRWYIAVGVIGGLSPVSWTVAAISDLGSTSNSLKK